MNGMEKVQIRGWCIDGHVLVACSQCGPLAVVTVEANAAYARDHFTQHRLAHQEQP
jgi:hypothetical protein